MSLIHYWRLDEESGSAVADSVGNFDGSVLNDVGSANADGLFGRARDLSEGSATDGKSHIAFPSGPATAAAEWTLVWWVKFPTKLYNEDGTVSGSSPHRYQDFWQIYEIAQTKNAVYVYNDLWQDRVGFVVYLNDQTDVTVNSDVDIGQSLGNWHLIAIRSNGTTVEGLFNQVSFGSASIASPVYLTLNGNVVAYAGRSMDASNSRGSHFVDELSIFDHWLSNAELAAIWNGGTGASIGSLYGLDVEPPPDTSWADAITTEQKYYALEIDDGVLDPIRIPISSWQATVQTGRASYAAAVIPGALQWVDAVNDRAEEGRFTVYRGVRYQNGETQETEMASAPLQVVQFDQGPINATMSISGYETVAAPGHALTRTLRNVRSRSISAAGLRVRCDIDFFLRPGHTAVAQGDELQVAYINYYVNSSDEYMDVGERLN